MVLRLQLQSYHIPGFADMVSLRTIVADFGTSMHDCGIGLLLLLLRGLRCSVHTMA